MQNDPPEPFPSLSSPSSPKSPTAEHSNPNRSRQTSNTSTLQGRLRSASKSFQESSPPTGMCIATAEIASSVPSLTDIRRGSYNSDGWSGEGQIREKERRASLSTRRGSQTGEERRSSVTPHSPQESGHRFRHESVPEAGEETTQHELGTPSAKDTLKNTKSTSKSMEMGTRVEKQTSTDQRSSSDTKITPGAEAANTDSQFLTTPFDNGYQFPPKHSWIESTTIFLIAFWKFFITPVGFLVTVYVCTLGSVHVSQHRQNLCSLFSKSNSRTSFNRKMLTLIAPGPQRRGLGRDAVLASLQRITRHVQTHV